MAGRYLDITGTLSPGMWSYGATMDGVPPFEQRRWATIADRGWESDWFAMPTLAGTYLETAKHLIEGAPSIDEIPPERLFVPTTVARIPKEGLEHITVEDLERTIPVLNPGDALLVCTGWDRHWWDDGTTFVGQSPHFELRAMQWIVDHRVSILGGDVPCFDDPRGQESQGVNTPLFDSDAMILAPLVNLGEWGSPRARLSVLPIPLKGSCGAPCRAILSELEGDG
jgi:arylformamidase